MAKKKIKKGRFSGKVRKSIERKAAKRGNYGYLQLPKGIPVFKEEEGKMQFDILPYVVSDKNHPDKESGAEKGEQWFCRPFKIHRNIGADNEKVVCLTSIGKKCPICEYRAKLLKAGKPKEETDALRPSARMLYNVQPKDHKKLEDKPHIWDVSEFAFTALLETEVSEKEKYEDFADLEIGYTLEVRFIEDAVGKNKFVKANRIDFEERETQYDEEKALATVADLDKVLSILSYEELEKKFLEMDDSDEADEDDEIEDDEPKSKKSRKKKQPEPEEDDEEDEEEEEDDEEEEEEEDDDDDEEDEDDDEDEEEEDDDDDDEDDEDDDEDDEDDEDEDDDEDDDEPEPSKKKKSSKKAPAKKPLKKRK